MEFMMSADAAANWTGGSGTGGSMARFMLNDRLPVRYRSTHQVKNS